MRTPQLPPRLQWDHNAYYHPWILRQLPAAPGRALDAGCGAGRLAGLIAQRAAAVDAVDRSPKMIAKAMAAVPHRNVRWLAGDVLDPDLPLAPGSYDAVTAVSSLHHMPLRPALGRLAGLVRPGGALVVVGHYRPDTVPDRIAGLLALPANLLVGVLLALRGRAGKPDDAGMPVLAPQATLAEIRTAATELLPGAHVRRRLFWRHSLVWRRPAVPAAVAWPGSRLKRPLTDRYGQPMQRLEIEHDFALPVERVYAYLSEHENLGPLFGATIVRLRDGATSRNGVGSVRQLRVGPLPAFEETVTAAIPNEQINYRITRGSPLRDHHGSMSFSRHDTGSHLRYVLEFGAVVPGLDRLVKRTLHRSITKGLASIDSKA